MVKEILKEIGLTENEIKIYLHLLEFGEKTPYQISQKTNIYRVHIYDKLEQLLSKGLVNYVNKGSKKYFKATSPSKLSDFLDEKNKKILNQKEEINKIIPKLESLMHIPKVDTKVEIFEGKEGVKFVLKDIITQGKDVNISGIDDQRYEDELSIFMKQYFRDLKLKNIKERVLTSKKRGIFIFKKEIAKNTTYRFLKEDQFNPTNTFIYSDKVVLITWGTPITSIMIKNEEISKTYLNHFEHLWSIASEKI